MKSTVDVRKALDAINIINSRGQRVERGMLLNGLLASSDFDGYTAVLANDYVTLTIFFHNKFDISYTSRKELAAFLEKIDQIVKSRLQAPV